MLLFHPPDPYPTKTGFTALTMVVGDGCWGWLWGILVGDGCWGWLLVMVLALVMLLVKVVGDGY